MQATRRLLASLPAPAASCRDRTEGKMCGGLRFAGLSSHSGKIGVATVQATWQLGGHARASAECGRCQAGRAAASCHLRLLAGSGLARGRPARWRQGLGGAHWHRSRRPSASESRPGANSASTRSWLAVTVGLGPIPNATRGDSDRASIEPRNEPTLAQAPGVACRGSHGWQKQIGTFPDLQANRDFFGQHVYRFRTPLTAIDLRARNPRFRGDRGWTPDPRQIGGGGGGGPPISCKSGVGVGVDPRSPANRGWDPHPHPRRNRGWGWGWGSGVPCPDRPGWSIDPEPAQTPLGQSGIRLPFPGGRIGGKRGFPASDLSGPLFPAESGNGGRGIGDLGVCR
jgi:hypothetical protein